MKKKVIIWVIVIFAVYMGYFCGTGFMKNGSVYLNDFSISEDGTEITLELGVAASAGNIRKAVVYQQHGGMLYFDCYCAFGGINGSISAKNTFTLPLDEDTTIIGVYRNTNCYEELLYKDADGIWKRKK